MLGPWSRAWNTGPGGLQGACEPDLGAGPTQHRFSVDLQAVLPRLSSPLKQEGPPCLGVQSWGCGKGRGGQGREPLSPEKVWRRSLSPEGSQHLDRQRRGPCPAGVSKLIAIQGVGLCTRVFRPTVPFTLIPARGGRHYYPRLSSRARLSSTLCPSTALVPSPLLGIRITKKGFGVADVQTSPWTIVHQDFHSCHHPPPWPGVGSTGLRHSGRNYAQGHVAPWDLTCCGPF